MPSARCEAGVPRRFCCKPLASPVGWKTALLFGARFCGVGSATALLDAELEPEIRRMAHPTLDFGMVVNNRVAAPLLVEFGGLRRIPSA